MCLLISFDTNECRLLCTRYIRGYNAYCEILLTDILTVYKQTKLTFMSFQSNVGTPTI